MNSDLVSDSDSGSASSDSDRLFGWTPQPQRFLPFVYVSAARLESGEGQKANRGETRCESRDILRVEVGPC